MAILNAPFNLPQASFMAYHFLRAALLRAAFASAVAAARRDAEKKAIFFEAVRHRFRVAMSMIFRTLKLRQKRCICIAHILGG